MRLAPSWKGLIYFDDSKTNNFQSFITLVLGKAKPADNEALSLKVGMDENWIMRPGVNVIKRFCR